MSAAVAPIVAGDTAAASAGRPGARRPATARRRALVAGGALVLLALLALLAPVLAPHDPARQFDLVALQNRPPSAAHPLGTDPFARDVLSRALHAGRVSLGIGLLAALVSASIGALWGGLAASLGRVGDAVMMRLVDAALGVPRVLVLLAIVALWGYVSPLALALLLGATSWLGTSRLVRAQVLTTRRREFVLAARALGVPPARLLLRHVAPHALATVAVAGTATFGDVVALEAGLSFLGLGVRPPQASWGSMIQDGAAHLLGAWWTAGVAILCVVATVLAASTLGDAVGDLLDPRRRD